ncbi:hypothetical protein PENSPDRAFT_334114 [Peniophora sp. CONT]|nr:hypothetical protein PENSPDRAFT_334114 [Peniophora sp. CONT]
MRPTASSFNTTSNSPTSAPTYTLPRFFRSSATAFLTRTSCSRRVATTRSTTSSRRSATRPTLLARAIRALLARSPRVWVPSTPSGSRTPSRRSFLVPR